MRYVNCSAPQSQNQDLADGLKSRWSKFVKLTTCPACLDDKGHAGILPSGRGFCVKCGYSWRPQNDDGVPLDRHDLTSIRAPQPIDSFALHYANSAANEIISALDPQATIAALMRYRGYDLDLARWLVERGVRYGSVAALRFKVSTHLFARIKLPQGISVNEPVLWLPVVTYDNQKKPFITGFQLRRTVSNANPRYITVRLLDNAPLVHVTLPTANRTDGQRLTGVWLTEGWFKAEITAYKFGVVAVGALGTGNLRNAVELTINAARWWHCGANLFSAPIVLAPDVDAKTQLSVAKAWWQAAQALENEGLEISFAVWDGSNNGIDDALLANATVSVVDIAAWLATLRASIRDELLKVRVRPRMVLDSETASCIKLPESIAVTTQTGAQVYEAEKRISVWLDTFAETLDKPFPTIVADLSPTGSGKTMAVARLRVKDLQQAGLPVKRIVYIAPEIKRAPVPNLEKWRLFLGRDASCLFYDRLKELEAEGLKHVGRRICAWCPARKMCDYYAQTRNRTTRLRVSWQSYKPREGDFVVLDEMTRLPLWRDFSVTSPLFNRFFEQVARLQSERQSLVAPLQVLKSWLEEGADKSHEEVVNLFASCPAHALDVLAHETIDLLSDIEKVRLWVFGHSDHRPPSFWWAWELLDILRGNVVGQVWCEKGMLRIKILDPKIKTMVQKASGILILDATADPTELERIFGAPVVALKGDLPQKHPIVIQVPLGALTRRARPTTKQKKLWVAKQVVSALQRMGKLPQKARIGVLTHKDAADSAKAIFGKDAVVGWFGRDDRQTNSYYEAGAQILCIVGLPHRNIGAVAAEQLKAGAKQRTLRKARLDCEGNYWTVLKEFQDPDLAAAVRREAAIAYLQAAGRLRQGRREEQCFVVVTDTEPLPTELNPIVLLPEQVLPAELLTEWQRRQWQHIDALNLLRKKAKAERVSKAAECVAFYRSILGEDPSPAWLARALGVHRDTARLYLSDVKSGLRTAEDSCIKHNGNEEVSNVTPLSSAVRKPPTYREAVDVFRKADLPVPVSAIAKRFGVSKTAVSKYACKPSPPLPNEERVNMGQPLCPSCSTPLEPEPNGVAGCPGCGRGWQVINGQVKPLHPPDADPTLSSATDTAPTAEEKMVDTLTFLEEAFGPLIDVPPEPPPYPSPPEDHSERPWETREERIQRLVRQLFKALRNFQRHYSHYHQACLSGNLCQICADFVQKVRKFEQAKDTTELSRLYSANKKWIKGE